MGLSDSITGILNFLTMLLSIPVIGTGIWLAKQHTDCYRFLQWPVILLGVFILLVSLTGFIGSCCRVTCLMWIYLVVMFILIVLLFIFTVFSFVVTNKGAGEVASNKGFKEYHLGEYSTWLQRQVNKSSNWKKIESCLSSTKVCSTLNQRFPTEIAFDEAPLTPLQSGCCKPPSGCQCHFVNAIFWDDCSNTSYDIDCTTYSTNSTELCFSCNSCRAALLQNLKQDWRKVASANIGMLIVFIIVYSVGCCAFRNVRRNGYRKGYR